MVRLSRLNRLSNLSRLNKLSRLSKLRKLSSRTCTCMIYAIANFTKSIKSSFAINNRCQVQIGQGGGQLALTSQEFSIFTVLVIKR